MKNVMTYAAVISMSAVLLGLMFYGFYIVLTSKDEQREANGDDGLSETELTVLQKKGKIISGKPLNEVPENKAETNLPNPPKKPGNKPQKAKKQRAA